MDDRNAAGMPSTVSYLRITTFIFLSGPAGFPILGQQITATELQKVYDRLNQILARVN